MSTFLIVDDDSESRETLAILVRSLIPGAVTLLAANGQIGVDLALLIGRRQSCSTLKCRCVMASRRP